MTSQTNQLKEMIARAKRQGNKELEYQFKDISSNIKRIEQSILKREEMRMKNEKKEKNAQQCRLRQDELKRNRLKQLHQKQQLIEENEIEKQYNHISIPSSLPLNDKQYVNEQRYEIYSTSKRKHLNQIKNKFYKQNNLINNNIIDNEEPIHFRKQLLINNNTIDNANTKSQQQHNNNNNNNSLFQIYSQIKEQSHIELLHNIDNDFKYERIDLLPQTMNVKQIEALSNKINSLLKN